MKTESIICETNVLYLGAEKIYAYHKLLCHTAFKINMQGDPTKPFIFNTSIKHKTLLVENSLLKYIKVFCKQFLFSTF